MLVEPWHGTYDDRPDWERASFPVLLLTALSAWAAPVAVIVWVWRRR